MLDAVQAAAADVSRYAGEAAVVLQQQLTARRGSHDAASVSGNGALPSLNGAAAHQDAAAGADVAPPVLQRLGLDVKDADALDLLGAFSDLATRGALADALAVCEALIAARRTDVLGRCACRRSACEFPKYHPILTRCAPGPVSTVPLRA